MDFLSICQRVVLESGISDTGPSSVEGQAGDMLRFVGWVNDAWIELQSKRNQWKWLNKSGSVEVAIGQQKLALPSDIKR